MASGGSSWSGRGGYSGGGASGSGRWPSVPWDGLVQGMLPSRVPPDVPAVGVGVCPPCEVSASVPDRRCLMSRTQRCLRLFVVLFLVRCVVFVFVWSLRCGGCSCAIPSSITVSRFHILHRCETPDCIYGPKTPASRAGGTVSVGVGVPGVGVSVFGGGGVASPVGSGSARVGGPVVDGGRVVSGGADGTVSVSDAELAEVALYLNTPSSCTKVASGRRLILFI